MGVATSNIVWAMSILLLLFVLGPKRGSLSLEVRGALPRCLVRRVVLQYEGCYASRTLCEEEVLFTK